MDNFDKEKDTSNTLKNIYRDDTGASEKVEFFPKIKQLLKNFWHSEKGLPYLIVFIGIVALPLGFWQYNYNMKGGSVQRLENSNTGLDNTLSVSQVSVSELSIKDTDLDGISDYDELYIFFTSPYLDDTDSDGYKDKDEIAAGTDPNCPKGKVCQEAPRPKTEVQSPETSDIANFEDFMNQASGDVSLTPGSDELTEMLSSLTPAQLRQLLIEAGAPADLLNNISDEQLKNMAQDALKNSGL